MRQSSVEESRGNVKSCQDATFTSDLRRSGGLDWIYGAKRSSTRNSPLHQSRHPLYFNSENQCDSCHPLCRHSHGSQHAQPNTSISGLETNPPGTVYRGRSSTGELDGAEVQPNSTQTHHVSRVTNEHTDQLGPRKAHYSGMLRNSGHFLQLSLSRYYFFTGQRTQNARHFS